MQYGVAHALRKQVRAMLSFHTAIDCHWLPLLRDSHTNLAVIAVIPSQNDGATLEPCDSDVYDFVMSHQVIQHIGDYDTRLSLLKDMHRVLRTDGMICLHYMCMDGSRYYESSDVLQNMVVEDPEFVVKDLESIGFRMIGYAHSKDHHLGRDEYYFTARK